MGKSASYEEAENARVSLSFYELLLLCRDFRIIPKIITKEELYYLWKVMNVQKGKSGVKVSRLVSFVDFKDFLARIAILAFNKPGIRRMLVVGNDTTASSASARGEATTGGAGEGGGGDRMPPPQELIGMLAKYMHLDDFDWVRNRVRTVGKATVSMINSRSAGEKNLTTKNTLREDLKGTRLAKILSMEVDNNSNNHVAVSNTKRRVSTGAAVASATGGKDFLRGSSAPAPGRPRSRLAHRLTAAQTQAQALEQKSSLNPFEQQVHRMLLDLEAREEEADSAELDAAALHQFSVASGASRHN